MGTLSPPGCIPDAPASQKKYPRSVSIPFHCHISYSKGPYPKDPYPKGPYPKGPYSKDPYSKGPQFLICGSPFTTIFYTPTSFLTDYICHLPIFISLQSPFFCIFSLIIQGIQVIRIRRIKSDLIIQKIKIITSNKRKLKNNIYRGEEIFVQIDICAERFIKEI